MAVNTPLFIPKLYCSLVGHQFKIKNKITEHIKEYKCSCCGKEVATSSSGKLVPLTPELKNIHFSLQKTILKRRSRGKILISA